MGGESVGGGSGGRGVGSIGSGSAFEATSAASSTLLCITFSATARWFRRQRLCCCCRLFRRRRRRRVVIDVSLVQDEGVFHEADQIIQLVLDPFLKTFFGDFRVIFCIEYN